MNPTEGKTPLPPPEFALNEPVIIIKYPERTAFVRYSFWHFKNRAHCYLLNIDGKKASRRYYAPELRPLGAGHSTEASNP